MQSVAFALPLLPGQTEPDRIALASCWLGARKEAFQDARRRAGIVREAVWIQPAPAGMLRSSTWRPTTSPPRSRCWATSAEPFDRWFRDHVRAVHGIALEHGFATAELVLDFDINRI